VSQGVREAGVQQTRKTILAAAAQVFVEQGVQAPIRDIAGRAHVGLGTVYRHFPTRAELVTSVYRHQIDGCMALADDLKDSSEPGKALEQWISAFVDFLATKHGLGVALQSDDAAFHNLHSLMLDQLVPACGLLVDAAVANHEFDPAVTAYALMRAVGNLCILGPGYDREDAQAMVLRLLAGCRQATDS
jgi:AcrR family transcriptional regulator